MIRHVATIAALCLLAIGCASSPSTAPSAPLTGSWRGTSGNTPIGTGAISAMIVQSGADLSGTWTIAFPNGAGSDGGALTGTFTTPNVTLTLRSAVPQACGYLASAALTDNRMTGTYATFGCAQGLSGPFELSKQ